MIGRTKTKNGYSIMNYGFDHTMSPEGKSVIVMRFDSPWELWKDIDDKEYKREKEQIEKDSKTILEKHYPGISDSVEVCDVATPITDVSYTGVWKGSYEGFMPSSKNLMDNLHSTIPGLKILYGWTMAVSGWRIASCRSIRQVGNSIHMQGGENRVQNKITAPQEIEITGVNEIFCKFKRSLYV